MAEEKSFLQRLLNSVGSLGPVSPTLGGLTITPQQRTLASPVPTSPVISDQQPEQPFFMPERGSAYVNAAYQPAFPHGTYTKEEINQIFGQDSGSGLIEALPADLVLNSEVPSTNNTTGSLQQEQVQAGLPPASSDLIGEAMARLLDNLSASEGLRKESTQYSLDQIKRAKQARAEANDPSKRSMNPLDWASFGVRNLLAPLALSPTMTRKQFMDKKYAAEEGATEEDIARARQQASDMANAVGQDNNLALAQLRQLGALQGMEQGQKMNPLDYVLKQAGARQAQAETSPEALDILEQLRGLSVEEANARIQHLRDSGKGVDPMSIILLKLLQGDLGQTGQSGQPDTASDFAWHE